MSTDLEAMYQYPESNRPWVRTDFVSTVDGAAWTRAGVSGDLGGSADKSAFRMMRNLADVILVGAGTARIEGYRPLTEKSVDQDVRRRNNLAPVPDLVVVSRSLDVPAPLIDGGAIILTSASAPSERLAAAREHADVIVCGDHDVDWAGAMSTFVDRGWRRVLCEGGPSLHGDLLAAELVDELCITIAPVVASGPASRIAHSTEAVDRPVTLTHSVDVDGVLLTRWVVDRS